MPMKQLVSQKQEIQNFIALFMLPCELATRILRSKSDCAEFMDKFYGRNPRTPVDDLLDFMEYQVEHNLISLENFLLGCSVSPLMTKATFEQTFFETFSDDAMAIFSQANISGRMTYETLYVRFKANPVKRVISYVV